MESDESSQSLQKQHVIVSDSSEQSQDREDHDQEQGQGQAPSPTSSIRSYECTFCKRGFSNAQALGGHMNIHRKHKAKLKQSSSSSSKDATPHHHHQQQQLQPLSNLETLYSAPTNMPTWPWNYQEQTNPSPGAMKQPHHLPLFTERPADKDDQTDHVSDSGQQLDLELRLGPEPNKDSAATTRKFF